MKMIGKSAILVALCLMTWLATSSLIAKQPPKKASSNEPTISLTPVSPDEMAKAMLNPSEKPIAMGGLAGFNVSVVEGKAIVAAKVTLQDSEGTHLYIWRLSLLDANGKAISHHVYEDQVFGMAEGGYMEPTFNDAVDLPPGKSMVQLSLFSFPKGTDLTQFRANRPSIGLLAARAVANVQN